MSDRGHQEVRIAVDPIACVARGICAELVPELVTVDEWGYPIIAAAPVPAHVLDHARRAVASCPTLALRLERAVTPARRSGPAAGRRP